jgi:hypothetical protein
MQISGVDTRRKFLQDGCHVLRTDPVSVYIYSLDPSIAP